MIGIRALLIRGSEKVIHHYHLLLARAKTDEERELYLGRIEREHRVLDQLQCSFSERSLA
ncbi:MULTISPECIES: hypothetical protein [unclassified Bradyrhizobium]|uniref:hypothetical protein n=1 Tax=unclassified Bradyrhizobium TaxID=2631580 RepID=UPI0020B1DF2D|nr:MULTISPECIES: hypothetical protein [unclassified Bradyrhizobium]MCP3402128.1 hypothetical protein [Bradyrhizobium sp. CCGB20]MCP3410617.1 hypothetical protein [Bradyrhizobium sp. CCGB01]